MEWVASRELWIEDAHPGIGMSWASRKWLESVDDDIREDTLRSLDEVRKERGEVFWQVLELISRADPERLLAIGAPPGEYVNEAGRIYDGLPEAAGVMDVRRVTGGVFGRAFGMAGEKDAGEIAGETYFGTNPDADLDELAAAIWDVWARRVDPGR